jgi:hypothetical protein
MSHLLGCCLLPVALPFFCMSSVTSCVSVWGVFICYTCLHTPFISDTNFTSFPGRLPWARWRPSRLQLLGLAGILHYLGMGLKGFSQPSVSQWATAGRWHGNVNECTATVDVVAPTVGRKNIYKPAPIQN